MAKPYSIRVFMPTGDPDGLRTIEKSGWSGIGLFFPRPLLSAAKVRPELQRPGVYLLIGPAETSGLPRVYVGEGDPIGPRLDQHAAKKDFWVACIAFASKDENLHKTHVQFLESTLVALARKAKRCELDNGNSPALPSMSHADAADAELFLGEMLLCLPVLGMDVFALASAERSEGPEFFIKSTGIRAKGAQVANGFLVRSGSEARSSTVPSCHAYLVDLRNALLANGVLTIAGDRLTFAEDYIFNSPSTAAGVVQGRAANGREDWKTKEGKSLKAIQESGR